MKKVLCITLGLVVTSLVCLAEEFYLEHATSGNRYGPFEYRDGAQVVLGNVKMIVRKDGGRPMTLQQRLSTTVIPTMDFRFANVEDVVEFLRESSIQFGPDEVGVNIILKPGAKAAATDNYITFKARDLPLAEALNAVTSSAGLNWRIRGNVVWVEVEERH